MAVDDLKSPVKNIPQCWKDDKRMTALYAPFRQREINPVDFDSKIKFWQNVIFVWCEERNDCILSIKKLKEEFRRNERVPLGLATVLSHLERNGQAKLKEEFLKIDPEESWTGWAVKSLVTTPVTWSFSKLKMALLEVDEETVEYVCIEFLKKKKEELLAKVANNQKVYNDKDVKHLLTTDDGVEISQENFDILLRWLRINKVIQTKKVEDDILVKFVQNRNSAISDIDISLYILGKNKLAFENAIQALEIEKEDLILTAKNYLRKGMRDTAKSYLRRKKEIEKTIGKRTSALENIEILLSRIHESSSDSKVFETYKIALDALKKSFKDNGLSEDEVVKTVTEIQEINEMHDEIQTALAEPGSSWSDNELENELKDIMEAHYKSEPQELDLPDVPTHSPTAIKETKSKTYAEEAAS